MLSSFWLRVSLCFHFSFLGYALYFLFLPVLSVLLSFFLQCFPDFVRYFLFLCDLLVIVSSVSPVLFRSFLCLRCFRCDCPVSSLLSMGLFQSSSSSAPILQHPLNFPICLCFSPVLVISLPPAFGFDSVLGVTTSPAVPAVVPPFFRPFVSASSFPHAAVPSAPCSLSLRFSHAAATAAPSCLPQCFRLLQLRLLLPVFVPVFCMLRL